MVLDFAELGGPKPVAPFQPSTRSGGDNPAIAWFMTAYETGTPQGFDGLDITPGPVGVDGKPGPSVFEQVRSKAQSAVGTIEKDLADERENEIPKADVSSKKRTGSVHMQIRWLPRPTVEDDATGTPAGDSDEYDPADAEDPQEAVTAVPEPEVTPAPNRRRGRASA